MSFVSRVSDKAKHDWWFLNDLLNLIFCTCVNIERVQRLVKRKKRKIKPNGAGKCFVCLFVLFLFVL